jgi:uncharacterized protein (TIGR01777 family)
VLSRQPQKAAWRTAPWDGKLSDSWQREVDGADAVIHLSGRTVNTRYTPRHRQEILDSRTRTTSAVAEAISRARRPPRVWLNASTATVYRHSLDRPQDEFAGEWGGNEAGVPATWAFGVEVGRQWEAAMLTAPTAATRKVAMRISLVMSPDPGGVFSVLLGLVRRGLGGTQGAGTQFVSWIHDQDFVRAVLFLLAHDEISGPVNLASPKPLPNREFMQALREAAGHRLALPATRWMLELGAFFMRTETELILKSRYVVPAVLRQAGFHFEHADWPTAAQDLVQRSLASGSAPRS